ncbi:MAG TPA: molybdopterin-dependent oxidoreductase [Tissierellaceae bacterium]
MAKFSRRTFLKGVVATGIGAMVGEKLTDGMYVYPDYEALAASPAPEEVKYTHCVMCNHGPKCGVKLIIKEGKVYRIEPREDYPNNLLCAKGLAALQELYDPNRLLYPVKRTTPKGSDDPKWQRITWDEALETIAEKFNEIKKKYGAEKVLFLTGDPKEPRSILQRLAYTFGSPNMGTESSTCYKATELSAKLIYGTEWFTAKSLATGGNPSEKTSVVLIWANNPAWSSPFSFKKLVDGKKANNAKYIVIDPRITPTVHALADVHLPIRPGTDGALALCFGNYLIEHDAYDKEFVEKWAHGFEEYKEYVKQFTIERTAEICDIPIDRLTEACEILANRNGPIVLKSSAAAPHHTNAVNDYRARLLLIPLTGSLDVPGGCTIENEPLQFDEWYGTFEFARSKDLLPKLDHLRVDREYFPVWADTDQQGSVQLNMLPEYVKTGKIKACLMLGGNAMMWPQSQEYQKAFQDMEFAVAADMYIRPWTHNYVDMVLPAAVSFERSAPLAVFGRRIYLREAVVKPAGEARPDYRICCDIGVALGYKEEFWGGGEKAEENCLREILRTLDVGVTYEDLKAAAPGPVTVPMKGEPKFKKYELGLLRPDGKPGFTTPTGKVEFASEILRKYGFDPLPVYKEPTYSPVSTPDVYKEFPLIMNSGNRVPIYTHSKERDLPWLNNIMPEPIVRLNPKDARERGLSDGDMVRITSPVNREGIVAKLQISNIVKPGVIDMFHGWSNANINLLIPRDFDKISGFPPFKEGLCQVEKA